MNLCCRVWLIVGDGEGSCSGSAHPFRIQVLRVKSSYTSRHSHLAWTISGVCSRSRLYYLMKRLEEGMRPMEITYMWLAHQQACFSIYLTTTIIITTTAITATVIMFQTFLLRNIPLSLLGRTVFPAVRSFHASPSVSVKVGDYIPDMEVMEDSPGTRTS